MKNGILIFFVVIISSLSATIINIPADQPTIQAGIDVAVDADTVLVQPGIYVENINFNGKNIAVTSLFLTTQDTIYISQTIIDGNYNESVVTFENGEDSTAVIIGFQIRNGHEENGGGISCLNSSPLIKNNIVTDNSSNSRGGGIYCLNSSPLIENNIVINNSSNHGGGGIYCNGGSTNLINSTIANNNGGGTSSGGGIYCNGGSTNLINVTITNNFGGGIGLSGTNSILQNVTVSGNHAEFNGGGIYCHNSNPSLVDVTISGNTVSGDPQGQESGGGIYCIFSSPSLENVIISNNSAYLKGGGIYCQNSSPNLKNVIILNNSTQQGGGIYCQDSSPSLLNVTISGNSGHVCSGIACFNNSNPELINCIMRNDSQPEIRFSPGYNPNSITISYSNIQGGESGIETNNHGTVYWQEGNIDADPLFVGSGEDPYSLTENSPCIDTGTPDTVGLNLPPWDIIGNERIWDGDGDGSIIIDMGAYEYGAPPYVNIDNDLIVQTPKALLHQNFPNPFNPTTTIEFSIRINSKVNLSIYNIKGQRIKTLINNQIDKGTYLLIWNGDDDSGKLVSSGVYLYKLNVNSKTEAVRKCLLLK